MASDPANRATLLERKLRAYKRNISSISKVDEESLSGRDLARFEAKLTSARDEWDSFRSVWDEREQLSVLNKGIEDFPSENWLQIYDVLRNEIIEANGVLIAVQRRQAVNTSLAINETANTTVSGLTKPHLPKIAIPTFSGDLLKWTHFRDTFLSMVHKQASLSGIEKFHYLLGALKGEAAALISRFSVEEDTYEHAWEKVTSTYDNPRVLASMLIHRIIDCDIKSCKSEVQRYEAFLTEVADSLESFRALKLPNSEEILLTTLALRALDMSTRKNFELSLGDSRDFPSADKVVSFVRQRMMALKMSQDPSSPSTSAVQTRGTYSGYPNRNSSKYHGVSMHSSCNSKTNVTSNSPNQKFSSKTCCHCKGDHHITRCQKFLDMSASKRNSLAHSLKLCWNCLYRGHSVGNCNSKFRCRLCNKRHHTLIHSDNEEKCVKNSEAKKVGEDKHEASGDVKSFTSFDKSFKTLSGPATVLLGTVCALIRGRHGNLFSVRALLDSASQHTFLTTNLAKKIGVQISPCDISITSLAESPLPKSHLKGFTSCVILPNTGDKRFDVNALVVDKITSTLPSRSLPSHIADKLRHYPLADPHFAEPKPVELLIGADIYHRIITGASSPSCVENLSLIPTLFGLVVTGTLENFSSSSSTTLFTESHASIERQMKRFWELEEPCPADTRRPEDVCCEEHFLKTHSRTPLGRYVVRLPVKASFSLMGNNREIAYRRFLSLENKFRKDSLLYEKYLEFIKEYIALGHMAPAKNPSSYVIPHHGIWQTSFQGTKLRVVFDASCASGGLSLNDCLHSGPKLQADICRVLFNFRLYLIPLCADLVKMYRQILIHEEDLHLQHIFWREKPSDAIQEFELKTVTYGIKPSAFQALRVIEQLVVDEGSAYPLAAGRVSSDMYVDDLVSGADSLEEAIQLQSELIGLLGKGGFALSKWASTARELIPTTQEEVVSLSINPQDDHSIKILGLHWNPSNDSFSYNCLDPPSNYITKRIMLSTIAKIFDPMGLLAPVIFIAKSLMQQVWKAQVDWDEELPQDLATSWKRLTNEWCSLSSIVIPRCVSSRKADLLLVGFSDASLKGYAAVLYLRAANTDGTVQVSLVKAKTKVAPMSPKSFVSIPRLELCGALLLSKLVDSMPGYLSQSAICFTDSETVLNWLKSPLYELKTFEANRTSQIKNVVPFNRWRHVDSADNPADLASRGCYPQVLQKEKTWWHGPSWLLLSVDKWYKNVEEGEAMQSVTVLECSQTLREDWTSKFSHYPTIIRIAARMLRFLRRTPSSRPISPTEYLEAELRCAMFIQRTYLPVELFIVGKAIPKSLVSLSPYLDEVGLVRVGGRIDASPLPESSKHPILLPYNSPLAKALVDHIHKGNFHAGPTLTLSRLRSRFWIPRAAKLIRSVISRCIRCRTLTVKASTPFMAALPLNRFNQFRAFVEVGVDYAGPFLLKESDRRNAKISKAYMCLFICFASKALHLELVTSLSTPSFLAALERFISRRGSPKCIWSDHGTNFVGASRFIRDVYAFQKRIEPDVVQNLSPIGIEWKFIPPRAPHFGGLWEAGVKSVKGLLARSIGKLPQTFEELTTVLVKIEALLNSRPLCNLTEDANDYDFLTPGHFLIGASLTRLPEPVDLKCSPRRRWNFVQSQISSVWERWRKEYIHTLMQRSKWTRKEKDMKIGELVILLERRSLLGQWPVARVVETYPGRDGTTRAVAVRTPSGSILTRAVTSLAPLFPPEESSSEE